MDPYLEQRGLWEEVHVGLIAMMQAFLSPLLRPRYRVAIERRVYLAVHSPDDFVGKPDVLIMAVREPQVEYSAVADITPSIPKAGQLPQADEVIERFLEVRESTTGAVVTVIELLSHSNKASRPGRAQYEQKRMQILGSMTNLVEIDLLRAGEPLAMRVEGNGHTTDYRIVVSRVHQRPRAEMFLFDVRDPIPDLPIPLRQGEAEPILPLNQVLHDLYDRAGYDLAIDYSRPAVPPLPEEDAAWAAKMIDQLHKEPIG
jgi:hypothetical protein